MEDLYQEIHRFAQDSERDFSETKEAKIKSQIDVFMQKIEAVQENKGKNKFSEILENKATIAYLKGKTLSVQAAYSKQAEEWLSKALRLDPTKIEHWNGLGKELWKKKDYEGAQKLFEQGM